MAWNDRYGRDYGASWYDRGTGRPGYESWQGGAAPQEGSYSRAPHAGSGGNYLGYDRQYRQPPSQSPNYGRDADRNVRQWARDYGYDVGYEIRPRPGGGAQSARFGGGYGNEFRGYSSDYDRGFSARHPGGKEGGGFFGGGRSGRYDSAFGRSHSGGAYGGDYDRGMQGRMGRWPQNQEGRWSRSTEYRW